MTQSIYMDSYQYNPIDLYRYIWIELYIDSRYIDICRQPIHIYRYNSIDLYRYVSIDTY
jgi:hypothetical protein